MRRHTVTGQISRRRFLQTAALATGVAATIRPAPFAVGAAPAALRGTKLHVLRWASYLKDEDAWFEAIKTKWAQPNGVSLTMENVNPADLVPKVSAAMVAGTGPDIVMLRYNTPHLYEAKLHDVSGVAEQIGKAGGGYYDAPRAYAFTARGQWKAVPWAFYPNANVYRADWLAGVGETKFPDTFEDANRVSKLILQKYKKPWGQAWSNYPGDPCDMAYPLLWSYGGAEVDKTGKKVAINSPESFAAVEFGTKWFKESMTPEMFGWDETSNNRAYLAGECWATNNGATIYLTALKDFPDLAKVSDHGPNPRGPKGRSYLADSASFGIPTYVKDPKPAEELLAWMYQPEQYNAFLAITAGYASAPLRTYSNHPVWMKDPKLTLFRDISEFRWPGWPGPASPESSEAHYKFIIVNMFAKAMQGTSPKEAVSWAEAELKRIYEK